MTSARTTPNLQLKRMRRQYDDLYMQFVDYSKREPEDYGPRPRLPPDTEGLDIAEHGKELRSSIRSRKLLDDVPRVRKLDDLPRTVDPGQSSSAREWEDLPTRIACRDFIPKSEHNRRLTLITRCDLGNAEPRPVHASIKKEVSWISSTSEGEDDDDTPNLYGEEQELLTMLNNAKKEKVRGDRPCEISEEHDNGKAVAAASDAYTPPRVKRKYIKSGKYGKYRSSPAPDARGNDTVQQLGKGYSPCKPDSSSSGGLSYRGRYSAGKFEAPSSKRHSYKVAVSAVLSPPPPDSGPSVKEVLKRVDEHFQGPEWKCFDDRVRVKTIRCQYANCVKAFSYEDQSRTGDVLLGKGGNIGGGMRPDLKAGQYLRERRYSFNDGYSLVGEVPGVRVGDCFTYRAELLLLALHRRIQAGIDYIPESKSVYLDEFGYPLSVAVSVVNSGGYKDNEEGGDIVMYTGQGGMSNRTHVKIVPGQVAGPVEEDGQDLIRGNLALKNSHDLGIPVRVIQGEGKQGSKIYCYRGLYDITGYFETKGASGTSVWKFKLVRQRGQPDYRLPAR